MDAVSRLWNFLHWLPINLSRALGFFYTDTSMKHLSCLGGETFTWAACTHGFPILFIPEISQSQTLPSSSLVDTDKGFGKLTLFVFSFIIRDFLDSINFSHLFIWGRERKEKKGKERLLNLSSESLYDTAFQLHYGLNLAVSLDKSISKQSFKRQRLVWVYFAMALPRLH